MQRRLSAALTAQMNNTRSRTDVGLVNLIMITNKRSLLDEDSFCFQVYFISQKMTLNKRLQRNIRPVLLTFKCNRFCPFIGFRTC